jgi:hypothetical protein
MTTSKTPYEVRLDVLKLAQDMLDSNLKAKQAIISNETVYDHSAVQNAIAAVMSGYTEEEVLTKANSLYQFITKKT